MLVPVINLIQERTVSTVREDNKIKDALTIMIEKDYSQLPIVTSEGVLIGIISEQSISRMFFHLGEKISNIALLEQHVGECRDIATTILEDSFIVDALELLQRTNAVIVVNYKKEPKGILTDYDMHQFFRGFSQDLIQVQNVELKLREYIQMAFPDQNKMDSALINAFGATKKDADKPNYSFEELSFYQHIKLITAEGNWGKFDHVFKPKDTFEVLMQQVRLIRNDLAHYKGKPNLIQQDVLKRATIWLDGRGPFFKTPVPHPYISEETVRKLRLVAEQGEYDVVSSSENISNTTFTSNIVREPKTQYKVDLNKKYEPFSQWLKLQDKAHSTKKKRVGISFKDIEKLIKVDLPKAARESLAWWTDNPNSQPHSLSWMKVGWSAESVDLAKEEVTFLKTTRVLYQLFFTDVIQLLHAIRPGLTRAESAQSNNWWNFGAGRTGFAFSSSFPSDKTLRVELYIDTGIITETNPILIL